MDGETRVALLELRADVATLRGDLQEFRMRTNEQFGDLKSTLQTIIDELASLRTDMLTHWQWHQERGDT